MIVMPMMSTYKNRK